MKRDLTCAWCGAHLPVEPKPYAAKSSLCPECHHVHELEGHRPMHPAGERIAHND